MFDFLKRKKNIPSKIEDNSLKNSTANTETDSAVDKFVKNNMGTSTGNIAADKFIEHSAEDKLIKNNVNKPTENTTEDKFIKNNLENITKNPLSEKPSLFSRLKAGLRKTRVNFANGLANLILGKKVLDADVLNLIETQLLMGDIGVTTTEQLVQHLTQKLARNELNDTETAIRELKEQMKNILKPCAIPLTIPQQDSPFVILVVGINGSGKTTTIGKITHQLKSDGKTVLLAAGDTFRAAAIEQLHVWGERNQIPVISQQPGADTAAVIYDAMESAKARRSNVLIADTAGRLHTQAHLMEELKKVKRVLKKLDTHAPHEVLLILDASIGQNALNQALQFSESIGITGIALTKLDGTAKGGIIFAIANQLKIPIRYIGVGEGIEDLRPFNADDFVEALF
ncbi:MAG: signal recognition particle-docking protein FtsY, partial [Gammaproteobacteria bacterium]|nr:signal recognition particle-docking protein FtsY [Gammaproteobacteria bacterium]